MLRKIRKNAAALKAKITAKRRSRKKSSSAASRSGSSSSRKLSWKQKISKKINPASRKKSPLKKPLKKAGAPPVFSGREGNSLSSVVSEEKVSFARNKYVLGDVKDKRKVSVKLPQRYFDNRLVLMVRDPWWIYAYWDISPEREREVKAKIPYRWRSSCRKIIRVYEVGARGKETPALDVDIDDIYFGSWYINVNKPGSSFVAEIGYLDQKGRFYVLGRSNTVSTPYFGLSAERDEEWILPEEEYLKILGLYNLGRSSLEVAARMEEIFKRQVSSLPSSFSASFPAAPPPDKFFFELSTELIIYGRTEPDADLRLGERKVPLSKDGTFRLRFLLPEGKFLFPFEARSSSGKHKIKISPQVERSTR